MQKSALARFFALSCVFATPLACDDSGGDGRSITGTTVATRTVTVGTAPVSVELPGKRSQGAQVEFPIGVTKSPVTVTVNLNEGVKKRGAEVGGAPVEIATLGLLFETGAPAKMRQPLPPAPVGKRYVAVYAPKEGDAWTILPTPPRVVGSVPVGEVDAGVGGDLPGAGGSTGGGGGSAGSAGSVRPGGEFDAGVEVDPIPQPQTAVAEEHLTYEIDVTGTGYWAIGYEVTEPVSSGGGAGCPGALSKLKGCGFSFQPAGADPCADIDESETCEINCIAKASCPQLTTLYCGGTPAATDTVLQCIQACLSSVAQIPCGDGESYDESDKCDGFAFCANGADEAGCVQFACGDGTQVPENNKCDGFPDCENGADEAGCPAQSQEADLYCPNGQPAFGGDTVTTGGDTTGAPRQ